jgi:ADP-heptose:LPS heptosyltransferase
VGFASPKFWFWDKCCPGRMSSDPAHFYSTTRKARKIIVVDLGFLGDTIHLVPALWELKRGYPQAALHVLTSPVGAEVLRMVACVEHPWIVEMEAKKRTLRQQWRVVRDLRRERFEVAFNLNGADRTIVFTALTGALWRVAYPGGRWHFWNSWLVPTWTGRQDANRPVFEQRRQVLAVCGLELAPPRFDLKPDEESRRWAESIIAPGTIHLSINASKPTKECTVEFHTELLRRLWKQLPEIRVLATAAAQQRENQRLEALATQVRDSRLHALRDPLSIPRLAALLQRCRLHIGPDSGVLHLAVALNVPTISFFRDQGIPRPFMPAGPLDRVISAPCTCPDDRHAPCERSLRAKCLGQIDPAAVVGLVVEELAK